MELITKNVYPCSIKASTYAVVLMIIMIKSMGIQSSPVKIMLSMSPNFQNLMNQLILEFPMLAMFQKLRNLMSQRTLIIRKVMLIHLQIHRRHKEWTNLYNCAAPVKKMNHKLLKFQQNSPSLNILMYMPKRH